MEPEIMEDEIIELDYYDVIPEYNSAGRLCNYHTGDGETVRVMADEWERFNEMAGRQHEVVDGVVAFNPALEQCLPDEMAADDTIELIKEQLDAQATVIASLLGASVELTPELVGKATEGAVGIEKDWQPGIVAVKKEVVK